MVVTLMRWPLAQDRSVNTAQALIMTVVLVAITALSSRRRHWAVALAWAAIGYVLCPLTWYRATYLAQLWFEPGIVAIIVDLAAWMAVTAMVVALRRIGTTGDQR
jgi:hypothetical protein